MSYELNHTSLFLIPEYEMCPKDILLAFLILVFSVRSRTIEPESCLLLMSSDHAVRQRGPFRCHRLLSAPQADPLRQRQDGQRQERGVRVVGRFRKREARAPGASGQDQPHSRCH